MNDNATHYIVIELNGQPYLKLDAFLQSADSACDAQRIYADIYPTWKGFEVDIVTKETGKIATIKNGEFPPRRSRLVCPPHCYKAAGFDTANGKTLRHDVCEKCGYERYVIPRQRKGKIPVWQNDVMTATTSGIDTTKKQDAVNDTSFTTV